MRDMPIWQKCHRSDAVLFSLAASRSCAVGMVRGWGGAGPRQCGAGVRSDGEIKGSPADSSTVRSSFSLWNEDVLEEDKL